jgi:protein arginine N-methyltransferase 1
MYSIADYGAMMADAVRMDAYGTALRQMIKPDSVVVDLGAGTGTFAMLACQFGARKVYAIEPDEAICLARAIAGASGLADRIEFIQTISTEAVLPERADIIVSDIRGVLPLFGRHIPSIADARRRLLNPSGVLIPRCDRIWAAVAEAPEVYDRHVAPWRGRDYGLDMQPARDLLANTWRRVQLAADRLLTAPELIAVLDYRNLEDSGLEATATWPFRRSGIAHGLCVWFDTQLTGDAGFSNAPGEPAAIYGQAFFPFADPLVRDAGDSIAVRLRAALVGNDYTWQWSVGGNGGTAASRVTQSTLHGVPLGPASLRKAAATYVPALNGQGTIDLFVLSRMQTATPLGEIARELLVRFPQQVKDWNAALGHVGELSRKYSKG